MRARRHALGESGLKGHPLTSVSRLSPKTAVAAGKYPRRLGLRAYLRRAIALRKALAMPLLLSGALNATALEPTTPMANYGRQSWVMENGLPQNTVQALVQTHDGFVWLGTEVGLVRFDGSGFTVFDRNSSPALPGNDVRCLLETRDGALWIGTREGLARWKDGVVKVFNTADGLTGGTVFSVAETSNAKFGPGQVRVWRDWWMNSSCRSHREDRKAQ